MFRSKLDVLPVELMHSLLSYFSTYEIFYSLTNVSDYIDQVLVAYSNHYVNFKSITKKMFEFVCQQMIPDQIISLTLCDDENTPGQIKRFLSRFEINQFINLRSLTLIDIGPDFWESIVTKLNGLKHLNSFLYITSVKIDSWISEISSEEVNQLDVRLFRSYSTIIPQLKRLTLSHGDFLESIQFPCLLHLTLGKCTINVIKHLCNAAPKLKSFKTGFRYNESNVDLSLAFNQLNRLSLKIEGRIFKNLLYTSYRKYTDEIFLFATNLRSFHLDEKYGTTIVKYS